MNAPIVWVQTIIHRNTNRNGIYLSLSSRFQIDLPVQRKIINAYMAIPKLIAITWMLHWIWSSNKNQQQHWYQRQLNISCQHPDDQECNDGAEGKDRPPQEHRIVGRDRCQQAGACRMQMRYWIVDVIIHEVGGSSNLSKFKEIQCPLGEPRVWDRQGMAR